VSVVAAFVFSFFVCVITGHTCAMHELFVANSQFTVKKTQFQCIVAHQTKLLWEVV